MLLKYVATFYGYDFTRFNFYKNNFILQRYNFDGSMSPFRRHKMLTAQIYGWVHASAWNENLMMSNVVGGR